MELDRDESAFFLEGIALGVLLKTGVDISPFGILKPVIDVLTGLLPPTVGLMLIVGFVLIIPAVLFWLLVSEGRSKPYLFFFLLVGFGLIALL